MFWIWNSARLGININQIISWIVIDLDRIQFAKLFLKDGNTLSLSQEEYTSLMEYIQKANIKFIKDNT